MTGDEIASTTGSSVIEIVGAEGFAGAHAALIARITCDPVCDMTGVPFEIRDADGLVLGETAIAAFDGTANETREIGIELPARAESMKLQAVLPAQRADHTEYPETSMTFEVTVKPNPVHMTVWDIPYSANAGEELTLKVGVKSAAGSTFEGRAVQIVDAAGSPIASAEPGAEPWPGTEALHVAEFSVVAPNLQGEHRWRAHLPAFEEPFSHAEGNYEFSINVTKEPEIAVTIEAISDATGEPVPGARVVMHPYRGETDAAGVVRIRAAKGNYTIFVSKSKYDPMSTAIALDKDFSTIVRLVDEGPEFNPDDNY